MKALIKKHYNIHKTTIHNFIWRSMQIFGKQGLSFFIFILCAKMLTPYDFGVYNYILAIIFFLIMFGDFGISTATSKYVVEYNLTDKNKLKSILFNSGLIIFALTVTITIAVLVFGRWYLQDKYIYVLYLLPMIFLSPMTSLYDGIYRGLKKFKKLAIISLIIGFLSIFFVYFLVKSYGLIGALISQTVFYLILLLGLGLGYRDFNFKLNKVVAKEVGKYSFTYGVAIFGNYLFIRSGILILGHYGYITQIGTYELLNKIFTIILLPFTLFGQVVAPNFSEFATKKQYEVIFSKLKKYSIYSFVVGSILGIILYFIIPLVIQVFFRNYYNALFFEIFPFTVLIFIMNVWAATIDAGILIPAGFAHLMANFYIILGIFGTVLSFALVNYFGYMGVVYSFTISSILMVVLLRIIFFAKIKKKIGI